MKMFNRSVALMIAFLPASIALAQDNCKVITSNAQVDQCAKMSRNTADVSLNDSYKRLLARFELQQKHDPDQGKVFMDMAKDAQRAWIKLRDSTCPLEATNTEPGVAAHTTTINNCIARMSVERAAYLDGIAPDGEGGVIDPNKISMAGAQRYGDVVVRYVTTFGSPCLNVQLLAPDGGWRVMSTAEFCSFDDKSFWDGYSDAGFENHAFAADGLHVTLSLSELRGNGEERRECVIPIQGGDIKNMKCAEP